MTTNCDLCKDVIDGDIFEVTSLKAEHGNVDGKTFFIQHVCSGCHDKIRDELRRLFPTARIQ